MRPILSAPLILRAQEKEELESLSRRRTAPQCEVQRANIILLAARNLTMPAIAATLQVCANTVRKWIRRYTADSPAESAGAQPSNDQTPPSKLSRLIDAPRSGRPDTFTPEQICAITALACEKPQDHGRPITHWTGWELAAELKEKGIVSSISARHVNRLLAATDLQPHRTRYWLNAKSDPQKEDKINAICKVYQQAQDEASRGHLTFSLDEMTGIQALERIAPDHPMKPGRPTQREFEYKRHGTLSLLAGLDVASGHVQASCRPTRNEDDFADLIDSLIQAHPEAVGFTFVTDNLNTHQSESLVRYVACSQGLEPNSLGIKGKNGILQSQPSRTLFLSDPAHRIRFCYTPKHASWMNQIEIWFGILMRKVIRRGNFKSTDDLQHQLEAFIDYFNRTMAKPFKWTYQGKPLKGPASA